MKKISFSSSFLKDFKKVIKNNPQRLSIFNERIKLLGSDPFHPKLKTHKLKGNLKHLWAFSIEYDLRVVFYFFKEDEIVLESIGKHDEVY
jgi:addiction module RelE/StbE family toxin